MKFARDQRRWLQWLFEAKKRFRTSILNYTVTSNHIHLVLRDNKGENVIPETMQLIAGRTGQEYNQRRGRKGAFWEDRYHATAVEADSHLAQCMVYIDLNMVRAGVVAHPSEWPFCGYNEIQHPWQRYSLIDFNGLIDLFNISTTATLLERTALYQQKVLPPYPSYPRKRVSSWAFEAHRHPGFPFSRE